MYLSKNTSGACALVFPEDSKEIPIMLVSSPPPSWLDENDLTKISISESGVYCTYLLLFGERGARACFSVDGREVFSSLCEEKDGVIFTGAVCSIRDSALPCALGVWASEACQNGIFIVVKCKI